MIYLSGCVRADLPETVGVMVTPMMGNKLPSDRMWCADTGCFSRPDAFTDAGYIAWLTKNQEHADRCLFATMPDVVGDAAATIARIGEWPAIIRSLGYPVALVAQDGLESLPVPWDDFDALFIGGTTAWKLGDHATTLMREAKQRGKHVHVGRVNSYRRFRHCEWQGADSVDGTFVAFGPDVNNAKLRRWIRDANERPHLL